MAKPDKEILKIEIPIEEEEAQPADKDTQGHRPAVKSAAARAGQSVGRAARQAWQSDARKTVTGTVRKGVARGTTAVAAKSAQFLHEHMVQAAEDQARQQAANLQTKVRQTDWRATAGKGAAAGLRWASTQVGKLAARLMTPPEAEETPPDDGAA